MAHLGNHQFARDLEDAMPAPGPFYRKATCAFCGAIMREGDKADECSHEEGQGGAAGTLPTAGELAQAERDEAAYQAHVRQYENAVFIDPEVDYRTD